MKSKLDIISELFAKKADENNTIDLNAYESGLRDMFEALNMADDIPRSFGMVRWYDNVDDDVACVSIEKAREYVAKYNKLSGKKDCYVDEEVWILLNEA